MATKCAKSVSLVCEQCSVTFEVSLARYKRNNVRFCSWECYKAAHPAKTLSLICTHCGRTFRRKAAQSARTTQHFCSRDCYRKWSTDRLAPNRALPPDAQVLAEFIAGDKLIEIAQRYGVSVSPVSAALRRMGLNGNEIHARPTGNDSARYLDLPTEHICHLYRAGMSMVQIATELGVSPRPIKLRLEENGIDIREAGFGSYQQCSDGHQVQSHLEYLVDEWLYSRGIVHEVQPSLPWNRRRRADFIAGDTFIEVWGVVNNPRYEQRKEEKIANYRKHKRRLIQLYPEQLAAGDFSPLEVLL